MISESALIKFVITYDDRLPFIRKEPFNPNTIMFYFLYKTLKYTIWLVYFAQ